MTSLVGRAIAWLGPWRRPEVLAGQLGVVLLLSLVWDILLALDNTPALLGSSPLAVVLTVGLYPVMVATAAVTIAAPGRIPRLMAVGRHLLALARPLLLVAAATLLAQVPSLIAARSPVSDDVTPSVICAARDTIRGHDPYQTPELRCLHSLGLPPSLGTALRAGPYAASALPPSPARAAGVSRSASRFGYRTRAYPDFGYPPLSFLWMLPVAQLGRNWWVVWTLAWAVAWVLAVARLAGRWWPGALAILLMQWGTGSVLGAATQGDAEFFAFALMSLALLTLSRPRTSSLALGLAIGTNPLAWVMAPAYLMLALRLPARGRRLKWLVGTLLLAFVPWLLLFPDALGSMLKLLTQPAYPVGTGLVALSIVQPLLPLLPRAAYFALLAAGEAAVLGAAAASRRAAAVAPILAISVLWLGWRSDANYLAQLPLLAGAMVIGLEQLRPTSPGPLPEISRTTSQRSGVGARGKRRLHVGTERAVDAWRWAKQALNPRPPRCKRGALPLSYSPIWRSVQAPQSGPPPRSGRASG